MPVRCHMHLPSQNHLLKLSRICMATGRILTSSWTHAFEGYLRPLPIPYRTSNFCHQQFQAFPPSLTENTCVFVPGLILHQTDEVQKEDYWNPNNVKFFFFYSSPFLLDRRRVVALYFIRVQEKLDVLHS